MFRRTVSRGWVRLLELGRTARQLSKGERILLTIRSGLRTPIAEIPTPALAVPYAAPKQVKTMADMQPIAPKNGCCRGSAQILPSRAVRLRPHVVAELLPTRRAIDRGREDGARDVLKLIGSYHSGGAGGGTYGIHGAAQV